MKNFRNFTFASPSLAPSLRSSLVTKRPRLRFTFTAQFYPQFSTRLSSPGGYLEPGCNRLPDGLAATTAACGRWESGSAVCFYSARSYRSGLGDELKRNGKCQARFPSVFSVRFELSSKFEISFPPIFEQGRWFKIRIRIFLGEEEGEIFFFFFGKVWKKWKRLVREGNEMWRRGNGKKKGGLLLGESGPENSSFF